MVHDLHHSVIHIYGEDVTVHITAYMEQDVIGVSIEDNRPVPQKITVSLQVPYHADRLIEDNALIYVHENGEDTCWHTINETAGMPDDGIFEDPLSGRCFGLAVTADGLAPSGNGWRLAPRAEHNLMIAAHSGKEAFPAVLTSRLAGLPTKAEMDARQAAWFDRFWSRVWFDCPDESMRPFTVSYDIYRYFTGICSGANREFPLRFQIVLLCNQMDKMHWATMQIHSIQTIQAYFGMLRNGDWDVLGDLYWGYGGGYEGPSYFTDVTVMDNDIYVCLDRNRGRLFGYDDQGRIVFCFGGNGNMYGYFRRPAAIEHIGHELYVLDSLDCALTVFVPTEFGNLVYSAIEEFDEGHYEASGEAWEEVMRLNGNYDLAYIGIGRSLLRQERYEEAMKYFELKYDEENYSKAYKQYRKIWVEEHIGWIVAVILILFLVPLGIGKMRQVKHEIDTSDYFLRNR